MRISAHAGHPAAGAGRTLESYQLAAATGADYVELDIRHTADEELVAFHDDRTRHGHLVAEIGYARLCDLTGYEVPKVADVLAVIGGSARGHLDLKEAGAEDRLVRLALDILGPGRFIVTSPEDSSIAAIRSRFPDPGQVPVALSLGASMRGASRRVRPRTRASEMRPLPRLRACGADWAAVHHQLAFLGVASQCRRNQVKLMVWTVNNERELRYWLSPGRADIVITDRPALAIAISDRLRRLERPPPS